jgi:hypothetical protein
MPTSNTITASFPIPDLTSLATSTNKTTYQSIRIAQTQLNSNATSIFLPPEVDSKAI